MAAAIDITNAIPTSKVDALCVDEVAPFESRTLAVRDAQAAHVARSHFALPCPRCLPAHEHGDERPCEEHASQADRDDADCRAMVEVCR